MAANAVSLYDPAGENSVWSAPQSATNAKLKIILPLKISRASAEDIQNRFFPATAISEGSLWAISMILTKNPRKNWMVILK